MNLAPPPASTCKLPGPWQDSQPVPPGSAKGDRYPDMSSVNR